MFFLPYPCVNSRLTNIMFLFHYTCVTNTHPPPKWQCIKRNFTVFIFLHNDWMTTLNKVFFTDNFVSHIRIVAFLQLTRKDIWNEFDSLNYLVPTIYLNLPQFYEVSVSLSSSSASNLVESVRNAPRCLKIVKIHTFWRKSRQTGYHGEFK